MRHPRKSDTPRGPLSTPRQQSPMPHTLYDTLEVIPTASPETIQAAYRSLISRYHPDRVAGLGPALQAAANTRTKEINYAYNILGDAGRRASYDKELRDAENVPPSQQTALGQDSPLARRVAVAPPEVPGPRRPRVRATLFAAIAGIAALLTLMLAANLLFGVIDFFVTGHGRYFQASANSIETNVSFSGLPYLLVMWVWLFLNYMSGLISYRLGVRVGQRTASGFDDPFAGANDRLLLFLTFVCAVACVELLSSAHTMPDILADMFVLGGAYGAERAIT
jgi:DnaJ domain